MIKVIHDEDEVLLPAARASGDALWIPRDDVERATGWAWKPEGLCRGDLCMPLPNTPPPAAAADTSSTPSTPMVQDDELDVAAIWRHAGWPIVHDDASQIWVLGEGAAQRADALASLEAPDFELPDSSGRMHRLSAYRGRRVFLVAWASW